MRGAYHDIRVFQYGLGVFLKVQQCKSGGSSGGGFTMSTSKCSSLVFIKLDCGDEGQEEWVLSVSLIGSSFIVIASFVSLSQAAFKGMAGKHSSSISAKKKK